MGARLRVVVPRSAFMEASASAAQGGGGDADEAALHTELLWVKAALNERELALAELKEQHVALVRQSEAARVNWESALQSKDRALEQLEAAISAQDRSIKHAVATSASHDSATFRNALEAADVPPPLAGGNAPDATGHRAAAAAPPPPPPPPTPSAAADATPAAVHAPPHATLAHPLVDDLRARLATAEAHGAKYKAAAHTYRRRAKAAEAECLALRQALATNGVAAAAAAAAATAAAPPPPALRSSAPAAPHADDDALEHVRLRERCLVLEKRLSNTAAREDAARRALAEASRVQREVKRMLHRLSTD